MSQTKIIITLFATFLVVAGVIVYNAFIGTKRNFTVLKISDYGICFMVSNELSFELKKNGFTYKGNKNNGSFVFSKNDFDPEDSITENNGLEFGYRKIKNFRVFSYKVYKEDDFLMMTDTFEFIKKSPLNLFPYKIECEEILKHQPKQIELELDL